MSHSWQLTLEVALDAKITSKQALGGGDFATAYRADLDDGRRIFIKTHSNPPARFFSTEATGLQWIRDSNSVRVPELLAFSDNPPFLALQWIEPGSSTDDASLGAALAALHRSPWRHYGRPDQRTTGSLALANEPCVSWAEFYANNRLLPLAGRARQSGALTEFDCSALELIADNLSVVSIADDKPSLLHGDLWAGNRIADSDGRSWLIDPAAHGGHREFDLAMMQLFGGYSTACFATYQEVFPLANGFSERVALHQLAPLVVHAIKFGSGYSSAVQSAISKSKEYLEL